MNQIHFLSEEIVAIFKWIEFITKLRLTVASIYFIFLLFHYRNRRQVKEQPGQVNSMSVKLSVMYRVTQYRVCSTLPHVVDVNWRLDYHVKVGVVTMDHMILNM